MNGLVRIILGIIVTVFGFGATGVGVYFLLRESSLSPVISIGLIISGLMFGFGGLAIAAGARIREIIEIFLLGS